MHLDQIDLLRPEQLQRLLHLLDPLVAAGRPNLGREEELIVQLEFRARSRRSPPRRVHTSATYRPSCRPSSREWRRTCSSGSRSPRRRTGIENARRPEADHGQHLAGGRNRALDETCPSPARAMLAKRAGSPPFHRSIWSLHVVIIRFMGIRSICRICRYESRDRAHILQSEFSCKSVSALP